MSQRTLSPGRAEPGSLAKVTSEEWLRRSLLLFLLGFLLVSILLPLVPLGMRSLSDPQGNFVGLDNYVRYFSSPGLTSSLLNSLTIAGKTTLLAVGLAFVYAWALARTCMPGKHFFRAVALLPLVVPPLALAIGLVYLFGKKGLVTTGFFGFFEQNFGIALGFDLNLYGQNGILLGELIYCFPQAFLILAVAASMADARLYEASKVLNASPLRTFWSVTLPEMRYGLISAVFVCFTLAFTDFGIPKVVGGNYNVLATDIYKQVIGQQNFVMGATVSIVLLLPTVLAFVADRIAQRHQNAVLTARATPLHPRPTPLLDRFALVYCSLVAGAILAVTGTVIYASLVDVWPYRLELTLRHYDFSKVGGGGWEAYTNSLWMAFYTAGVGTAIIFAGAYLIEKSRTWRLLRQTAYFLSMISVALPGLVIGLAYIFLFNPTHWTLWGGEVPNPFAGLYGTMAILVLSNIVHFYTVSFMAATTALKQIDGELEAVSASLGVPFYRTFWRITLPLSLPAVAEIALYLFVNAMVTVSAVILLYSPQIKLASVAIVNLDDAGDTAAAAAMSVLVIAACLTVRVLYFWITRHLHRRTQAWRLP
jgi:iron(III) transport system permease protein